LAASSRRDERAQQVTQARSAAGRRRRRDPPAADDLAVTRIPPPGRRPPPGPGKAGRHTGRSRSCLGAAAQSAQRSDVTSDVNHGHSMRTAARGPHRPKERLRTERTLLSAGTGRQGRYLT
jgi:hypothetical protein